MKQEARLNYHEALLKLVGRQPGLYFVLDWLYKTSDENHKWRRCGERVDAAMGISIEIFEQRILQLYQLHTVLFEDGREYSFTQDTPVSLAPHVVKALDGSFKAKRKRKPQHPPTPDLATTIKASDVNISVVTPDNVKSPGSELWTSYTIAYLTRYPNPPIRNAKNNALAKKLVDQIGLALAIQLVMFYLQHPDEWYMRCHHTLDILIRDIQRLTNEMKLGRPIDQVEYRMASRDESTRRAFNHAVKDSGGVL